jgi:hypothetical protein
MPGWWKPTKVSDREIAAAPFIRLEGGGSGVSVRGKAIVMAILATFVGAGEAVAYRGWDSTLDRSRESALESLSERDPYALYGPRDYLPPSYYPRYFGARLCYDPRYGRPRRCYGRQSERGSSIASDCNYVDLNQSFL